MSNIEKFKNKPEGFKKVKKQLLVKVIPVIFIAGFVGLGIGRFNTDNHQYDNIVLPVTILFLLVVMSFSMYRSIKRQKQIFESYTLRFQDGNIIREQYNTPVVSIPENLIIQIFKTKSGIFVIKSSPSLFIVVSEHIEDYERVEELLKNIKEFSTPTTNPVIQKIKVIVAIGLPMVLASAVFSVSNKIIVGICGTALLTIVGYSFYKLQTNKNIDHRTKRGSWFIILLVVSIVSIMYIKLTNG